MKRITGLLLTLLLATALVACGTDQGESRGEDEHQDSGQSSADPDSSATADPSEGSGEDGTVDPAGVRILHQTDAGGETDEAAVPLRTRDDVEQFVAGFDAGMLTDQVRQAFGRHASSGSTAVLYGAVVQIGCAVPDDVVVTRQADHLAVTPEAGGSKGGDPKAGGSGEVQCFAPVTTVALVEVEKADVPD